MTALSAVVQSAEELVLAAGAAQRRICISFGDRFHGLLRLGKIQEGLGLSQIQALELPSPHLLLIHTKDGILEYPPDHLRYHTDSRFRMRIRESTLTVVGVPVRISNIYEKRRACPAKSWRSDQGWVRRSLQRWNEGGDHAGLDALTAIAAGARSARREG